MLFEYLFCLKPKIEQGQPNLLNSTRKTEWKFGLQLLKCAMKDSAKRLVLQQLICRLLKELLQWLFNLQRGWNFPYINHRLYIRTWLHIFPNKRFTEAPCRYCLVDVLQLCRRNFSFFIMNFFKYLIQNMKIGHKHFTYRCN